MRLRRWLLLQPLPLRPLRLHLRRERAAAEDALRHVRDLLARADGPARTEPLMLTRKEAADSLDTTIDALRNWEMNGLLQVKRKRDGYRVHRRRRAPLQVGVTGRAREFTKRSSVPGPCAL